MGTLLEDRCTFMIISLLFILRMRNVTSRSCRGNQTTYFMFNNLFFKKILPSMEKYFRGHRRMRIACWVNKATETHSEYVVLIAFTLQRWLNERAQMLRYTYCDCLVCFVRMGHIFLRTGCCITVM
jgi:hypothetical protein